MLLLGGVDPPMLLLLGGVDPPLELMRLLLLGGLTPPWAKTATAATFPVPTCFGDSIAKVKTSFPYITAIYYTSTPLTL